jgi:potassium/chloride transporter 9
MLPESCTRYDSTCMLMLQLACILNMVSVWRRAVVRVFLCTDSLDEVENSRRKTRLDSLLNQLRIHAMTCVVPLENVKNLLNRQPISDNEIIRLGQAGTNAEVLSVSDTYFKSVNQLIRQFSEHASLCFLYLPSPPSSGSMESYTVSEDLTFNDMNHRYMKALDLISDALPPTLFVNGVSCVTSTNL